MTIYQDNWTEQSVEIGEVRLPGEKITRLKSHHSYASHAQTLSQFKPVTSYQDVRPAILDIEQTTRNISLSRYVFSFDFVIGAGETTDIDAI